MRLLRFLPLSVLLAVALLAAGCGGSSKKSVPADAGALVGGDTITKAQINALIAGAQRNYTVNKKAFPKPGTTQYKSIQDQALQYLVQEDELGQRAKQLKITITPKDVAARLVQIKAQGLTQAQVEQDLYAQILSEKLYNKITAPVKVSDADVKTYYLSHQSAYHTAASRDVRHILVNNKALADQLETQLKSGGDFAKLAKKYSKDPGSAAKGGKLTITKGQTVAAFDKEAFTLKTGETSAPVHTQYGWHIIQALSAIKPAKQTPLASVKDSIRQQLLQSKKTTVMTNWVNQLKKDFAKNIAYGAGYEPAATSTSTTATTTSTG